MDREEINIGSSGIIQVSRDKDYFPAMKEETRELKRRLNEKFPPPDGCRFRINNNSHDFGTYEDIDAVMTMNGNEKEDQEKWDWVLKAEAEDLEALMKGWQPSEKVRFE